MSRRPRMGSGHYEPRETAVMKMLKRLVMGAHASNSEVRIFRSFFAINIIAIADILLHLMYLILFSFFAKSALLLAYQSLILAVNAFALYTNHRGIRDAASIILTVEIGVSSVVWVIFLGPASYMQFFAFCGMLAHYLFTDISKKKRRALMIFLFCAMNLSLLIQNTMQPLVPDVNTAVIGAVTVNAVFATLILELLLSNIASGIAQAHYESTLAKEKNISMKDPLTGLWNRRYIQLQEPRIRTLSENVAICVAMLDLDRFKLINDAHGHATGDLLLQHFSRLLKDSFRSTDVAIRWGGEEFMLLMMGVNRIRAHEMLVNFLKKTKESPLTVDGASVSFSFTAGVSDLTPDMTLELAIEEADRRMYIGKAAGRSCVVIHDNKPEVN